MRHMVYTIFIPWSGTKIFENYFQNSLFLVKLKTRHATLFKMNFFIVLFQEKFTFIWKNLPSTVTLHLIFRTNILQNSYYQLLTAISQRGNWSSFRIHRNAWHKKINKTYHWKLKPSKRSWAFEKLFCIIQFSQLAGVHQYTASWLMCFTDKHPGKPTPIKFRANLRPPATSK